MAYTTLTRYLKLKVDSDLSADAVYNLQRIDALASTFVVDATEKLKIQSKGNIEIEPNDLALGGTGTGGSVEVGTEQHKDINFKAFTASFKVDSGIETKNQATNKTNYLKLAFNSSLDGDKTLTFDLGSANRSISFETSGVVVTADGAQTLTDKSISGSNNTLSDIAYSSLLLTDSIVNADIASDANIADTKLATITTAGKVANSATTATSSATPNTIVARNANGDFSANDITAADIRVTSLAPNQAVATDNGGNLVSILYSGAADGNSLVRRGSNGGFSAGTINATLFNGPLTGNVTGNVTGDVSGTASNVTGVVAIENGGTGATTAAQAIENLLPSYSSNADKILALNSSGTGLEWKLGGGGTVDTIAVSSPLSVDDTVPSEPSISISQADSGTDGYLSSADWSTFNSKEPAITGSGNASQFWNGNKTFAAVTKSDVGLGNVDNTSDADKPVSSATQTALNAKYDASNPSNFVDAAGAKSAAVVNSTAGSETDQAPSVSAMKSYVTANSGPKFSTTWTVADGNSKTVTHSLGTREVLVTIYDESYETVYVDSETRTDTNTVTLVRVGTATGTWTVVVKKL